MLIIHNILEKLLIVYTKKIIKTLKTIILAVSDFDINK
jgi:hypothetical protein